MEKILLYFQGFSNKDAVIGIQYNDKRKIITFGGFKRHRNAIQDFILSRISKKHDVSGRYCQNNIFKVDIHNFTLIDMYKLTKKLRQKRKYGYEYESVRKLGAVFGIYERKTLPYGLDAMKRKRSGISRYIQ